MKFDFSAINLLDSQQLTTTWDVGRRCNYDCTYCPPHRHDGFSPYADLDTLIKTGKFVLEYADLLMRYKKFQKLNINFTGGEPTLNPHFIEFGSWMRKEHNQYWDDNGNPQKYRLNLTITSNGHFGPKMRENILKNYGFITISYHCEQIDAVKENVVKNIKYLHDNNFALKVNVMFHVKYFEECKELCKKLHEWGVTYVPRMIGEHENPRYAHKYSEEQLDWMKNYWKNINNNLNNKTNASKQCDKVAETKPKEKKFARQLGRPCCGNRVIETLNNDGNWEKTKFIQQTKFKDWYCSVNWFFLHIEQQTDKIFHHQTCQAKFNGTRGHIGTISNSDEILNKLYQDISSNRMPIIKCPLGPGDYCGCGLCTPKTQDLDVFKNLMTSHVKDTNIFNNSF